MGQDLHSFGDEVFHTETWWDERGPFKILHQITPLRIEWILNILTQEGLNLKGMNVLDIGCGGGLLAEPLARLGAHVVGIDVSQEAIVCAQDHARSQGFLLRSSRELPKKSSEQGTLWYQVAEIQEWQAPPSSFNLVIMMEVLEHIAHPFEVLQKASQWLTPGGMLIGSTLNRTFWSYILGIGVAEYLLRWVPPGTHQWGDFIKPQELAHMLREAGFESFLTEGFRPFEWQLTSSTCINYFFAAQKPARIS